MLYTSQHVINSRTAILRVGKIQGAGCRKPGRERSIFRLGLCNTVAIMAGPAVWPRSCTGGRSPKMTIKRWVALVFVVVAGLALRAYALESISLWGDETDLFFSAVYDAHPQPLVAYALERRERTTGLSGWPVFIWVSTRALGRTAAAA